LDTLQRFFNLIQTQVDGDGNSPLHWAAVKGHANIIDLLLLAQADPNLPNKDKCDIAIEME
jgi:ankyrin repeat protein